MAENLEKRSRTRKLLKNALIELCGEKPYYDITILDICGRAGVYRSTFYRYYEAKDDMLREIEYEYIEDTRNLTPTLWSYHADASPEMYEQCLRELTADMEYHREHRKLCQFLLSPAGDIVFHAKMVESVVNTAKKGLQKTGADVSPDGMNRAIFFANGFIATIHEWLKNGSSSAQEIAAFLLSMIAQFLQT